MNFNKKDYPYIAIFKTLPEPMKPKKYSKEELDKSIEEWRSSIKDIGFSIIDSKQDIIDTYVEKYLTQELYDFINTVSIIETTSNYMERVYRINTLTFTIIENKE